MNVDELPKEEQKHIKEQQDFEASKFKVADKDGDGKLSLTELPAMYYPDLNDDLLTMISQREMKAPFSN